MFCLKNGEMWGVSEILNYFSGIIKSAKGDDLMFSIRADVLAACSQAVNEPLVASVNRGDPRPLAQFKPFINISYI